MYLKLKRALFSRDRSREKEKGYIFSKTSNGITNVMPLVLTLFFTPVLITTSLFSKEIIIILANLSLCAGYLINFCYRIYRQEVSPAELLVSILALAGFIAVAYFLGPSIGTFSFITAFIALNQIAVAINLFFLIKHVLVPPCKKLIENISQYLGFNIKGRYYTKPPLTLEHDRTIIDLLLIKTYGYDSFSPKYNPKQLEAFNALLTKQSLYIDKYDESILGYIYNRTDITNLENQIFDLTVQGNPDSSYTFIRKKISFKTTKINLLLEAQKVVSEGIDDPENKSDPALRFFKGVDKNMLHQNPQKVLNSGFKCLQKEIEKQQQKIEQLKTCLPIEEPPPTLPTYVDGPVDSAGGSSVDIFGSDFGIARKK